jgi:cellular nucleic acid-binding protein
MMFFVYVLECENNKYYVGETMDIDARFIQHRYGGIEAASAAIWTTLNPPIKIIWKRKTNNRSLELIMTLEYMKRYGIQNVRGSHYSQRNLSPYFEEINEELSYTCSRCGRHGHSSDECNCDVCGKRGHLASQCNNCYNCGKGGHYSAQCYNCYKCGKPGHHFRDCNRCYNCNEYGHFANRCPYS